MYKNYRYCIITADLDCGVRDHPQKVMRESGYTVIKAEPCSIADCWWFRVDHEIENPPPFLTKMSDDFKFSDER